MPTVAYLGPEHTNTHAAAQARFGRRASFVHAPTIDEVFHLVERREAEFGVVPIENSLEGAVTHTLDRFIEFLDTPVKIHGETEQPIQHSLIVRPGARLDGLEVVYSHPQALAQCRRWLAKQLPRVYCWETPSTAEAVAHLLTANSGRFKELWAMDRRAAIGRIELAKEHHLKTIPIPQDRDNKTRFLILGLGPAPKGRRNKTSLLFALKDRPGALYDALLPFKRERINLTKIESRPSRRKAWEYYFFIDLEHHTSEPRVKRALADVRKQAEVLQIMGSYPIET